MALTATRTAEVAHAREVDEKIASLWGEFYDVQEKINAANATIRKARKMIGYYGANSTSAQYYWDSIGKAKDQIAVYTPVAERLSGIARQFDDENYGGWSRFFHVIHLHKSMHCSSFRVGTRVGWMPNLSGLTEAEAVAEFGPSLCTKCFPSAPVEWTQEKPDESLCEGSGKGVDWDHPTGRENAYYSPSGTCSVCGQRVTLTSRNSGRVRKHKKEA